MKQLAAVQLVGNAAALSLGYYWLSIGEARMGLLAWSFMVAVFTSLLFVWLHGAGFIHGLDPRGQPFRQALRRLPSLFVAALVLLAVYLAISFLAGQLHDTQFKIASWLTLKLRKPVKPAAIRRAFDVFWWIVRWIVIPVLARPWVVAVAESGWRGLIRLRLPKRTLADWAITPALLLAALWLPFRVLAWKPFMNGFAIEMASFIVRFAIAYLLFAGGLMALEGMPLFTQRRTSPSP
jgi:hypothetical protein